MGKDNQIKKWGRAEKKKLTDNIKRMDPPNHNWKARTCRSVQGSRLRGTWPWQSGAYLDSRKGWRANQVLPIYFYVFTLTNNTDEQCLSSKVPEWHWACTTLTAPFAILLQVVSNMLLKKNGPFTWAPKTLSWRLMMVLSVFPFPHFSCAHSHLFDA